MTKYKEYYQKMLVEHEPLFKQFMSIHDAFERDPAAHEADFHAVGQQVLDKVRDYDRRLCSAMGRGVFSTYSQQLSEKFWGLLRQDFAQIDMVGVKTRHK